jgi:hypothetical protein
MLTRLDALLVGAWNGSKLSVGWTGMGGWMGRYHLETWLVLVWKGVFGGKGAVALLYKDAGRTVLDLGLCSLLTQDLYNPRQSATMKSISVAAVAALLAGKVASHAIFQDLWVAGVDMGSQCARLPSSNSPVTSVSSNDIRCNAGTSGVAKKCAVAAGSTVTVEMHQVTHTPSHPIPSPINED